MFMNMNAALIKWHIIDQSVISAGQTEPRSQRDFAIDR